MVCVELTVFLFLTTTQPAVIFAEPHINIVLAWNEKIEPIMPNVSRYAWVPHYYDLLTLLTKTFRKYIVIDPLSQSISFDPVKVHTKMLLHQLDKSRGIGSGMISSKPTEGSTKKAEDNREDIMLGSPALIGETGICFDQNEGEAYVSTVPGDIMALQTIAYDSLMQGIDQALASVTLWNYSPNNSNLHGKRCICFVLLNGNRNDNTANTLCSLCSLCSLSFCFTAVGDGWNEEDLSIFSYDQQADPFNVHSGGRGLPAIVRPYASRISGVPISMKFRAEKKLFTFTYDSSQNDKCKRTFYSRLDVFFA